MLTKTYIYIYICVLSLSTWLMCSCNPDNMIVIFLQRFDFLPEPCWPWWYGKYGSADRHCRHLYARVYIGLVVAFFGSMRQMIIDWDQLFTCGVCNCLTTKWKSRNIGNWLPRLVHSLWSERSESETWSGYFIKAPNTCLVSRALFDHLHDKVITCLVAVFLINDEKYVRFNVFIILFFHTLPRVLDIDKFIFNE